jgi:hypothetical protein
MRIALLDVKVGTKIGSNFTAVNMRNMILLQKELGADFYYSTDQLINNNKEYDAVLVGFGSMNSEAVLTRDFIKRHNNIIFIVGEYEQKINPALSYAKNNFKLVRNYEGRNQVQHKDRQISDNVINLNLLIAKQANQLITKKYDCIYYGRWRGNRADYFKKYIQNELYLSTSTKNMKKFKHEGCNPKYLDTISWEEKKETLNLFRYSLYIEDVYTHSVFNNLANRWYEAGFCNVVMFFDVNCLNTIRKSEIAEYENEIQNYLVTDYNSLQAKINECNQDFEKHLAIQKNWRKNELELRAKMIDELKEIIYS